MTGNGRIWASGPRSATRPLKGAHNLCTKFNGDRNRWGTFSSRDRRPMVAMIAYARVSTGEQNPDYQEHALRDAGAERVFVDHGESSTLRSGPQCGHRVPGDGDEK